MDGAVAQAALKTSLVPNPLAAMTTKMNPLGQGGTGPGDIETGLAPASASAEEEKNKPFLQKMLDAFLKMDLEDKVLAIVGAGCLIAAIVCLISSTMLSAGFFISFVAICWCMRRITVLEMYKTLAESVGTLQAENDELKGHVREIETHVDDLEKQNDELEQNVDQLEALRKGLDSELTELKEISDLVGEKGDAMIKSLTDMYGKYKGENDRHQQLLEQQSDFHFYQILQHFDQDFNGSIEEGEIENLIKYLANKYNKFDESLVRDLGTTIPVKDLKAVLLKIGDWGSN